MRAPLPHGIFRYTLRLIAAGNVHIPDTPRAAFNQVSGPGASHLSGFHQGFTTRRFADSIAGARTADTSLAVHYKCG
jgi:hypothetical protein